MGTEFLFSAEMGLRAKYEHAAVDIARLVAEKQVAYGDSFGRSGAVMALLYPDGVPPAKLDDALAVVRVIDKLFRIATDRDALGEDPWRDVAGYALLAHVRRQEQKQPEEEVRDGVQGDEGAV